MRFPRWPTRRRPAGGEEQLALLLPLEPIEGSKYETLGDRFEAFHQANPHVYRELVRLVDEALAAKVPRGSISRLFEVLRWKRSLLTRGEPWKLNNSFRAFYARKIMERGGKYAGWFETRKSQADACD